jgi:hypothetical protein
VAEAILQLGKQKSFDLHIGFVEVVMNMRDYLSAGDEISSLALPVDPASSPASDGPCNSLQASGTCG